MLSLLEPRSNGAYPVSALVEINSPSSKSWSPKSTKLPPAVQFGTIPFPSTKSKVCRFTRCMPERVKIRRKATFCNEGMTVDGDVEVVDEAAALEDT